MSLERLKIDKDDKPAAGGRRARWIVPSATVLVLGIALWLVAGERIASFVGRQVLGAGGVAVQTVRARRLQAAAGAELTTASGYVVSRRSASLGSKVLGRLAKLYAEPGDRVKTDAVLAELEHEDLDAAVAAAKADVARTEAELREAEQQTALVRLRQKSAEEALKGAEERSAESLALLKEAERELERAKGLFESGTGSDKDLDRARTQWLALKARNASVEADRRDALVGVEIAKQQVEVQAATTEVQRRAQSAAAARLVQAEAIRDDAFIRAPFDGVILRKEAEVGEIVAPSPGGSTLSRSAVLTMAAFDSLELEVDVFERDIRLIEEGGPASIRLDAYPDRPRSGRVRLIRPTADRQKATVQVKVAFDEIPDFARPEMAGTVVFLKAGSGARAEERTRILVPIEAVTGTTADQRVWIVSEDRARPVRVRLGPRAGGEVEVVEGLRGGENVILEPPTALEDGTMVRVTGARGQG